MTVRIRIIDSSSHRFRIVSFSSIMIMISFGLLLFFYFSEFYNASFRSTSIDPEEPYYALFFSKGNRTVHHHHHHHHHHQRKLLASSVAVVNEGVSNRIGELCSKDDIAVYQGPTTPLPNGIPTYTVQILNVCVSGCSISNIHVSCGWFSSARLINPRVFRRVYYDDCLVNNGEPLGPGDSLSFQYANSFRYPLSVSSVTCC